MDNGLFIFQFFQPVFFEKAVFLVLCGLFIVFCVILFIQTKTMNGIVHLKGSSYVLEAVAILLIFWAVSLFVLALVIL